MKDRMKEMFVNLGFLVGVNWDTLTKEEMEDFSNIFEKGDFRAIIDKLYSKSSFAQMSIDKDELLRSIEDYRNRGNTEIEEEQMYFFKVGNVFGYAGSKDNVLETAEIVKKKDNKNILEALVKNVPHTLLKKRDKVQLITESKRLYEKKEELNEDKVFNSYMKLWRQKLKERM